MVRGQWENLARMPGLHPYSFSKDILGFRTWESGPRFNVSSEGRGYVTTLFQNGLNYFPQNSKNNTP